MENDVLNKMIDLIVKDIESITHNGMFRKVIDVAYGNCDTIIIKFNLEDLSDGVTYLDVKDANRDYVKWRRKLLIKLETLFGTEKFPYKEDNTNWYFEDIEVTYKTFGISFYFYKDSITKYMRERVLNDLLG